MCRVAGKYELIPSLFQRNHLLWALPRIRDTLEKFKLIFDETTSTNDPIRPF